MIDLIFEGTKKPCINKFNPIKNIVADTKPQGGLWTSPMMENGQSAWRSWCQHSNFRTYPTRKWHIILEPNCRILNLDENIDALKPYIKANKIGPTSHVIDYEKLSLDYDFMYVSDKVVKAHKNDIFNCFEIESGLFLHPTFKALDDKEFAIYKQKQAEKGNKITEIKEIEHENIDLATDPVMKRLSMALDGELGEDEQMRAIMSVLSVIKSRL